MLGARNGQTDCRGLNWILLGLLLGGASPGCGDLPRDSCGAHDSYLDEDALFPGTPQPEADFAELFTASPYDPADCPAQVADLGERRELYLFQDPGSFQVSDYTQGLQRFFGRFGLEFFTRRPPRTIDLDWVYNDDPDELTAHLQCTFPDVDFESETAQVTEEEYQAIMKEMATFMLKPMLDFERAYRGQGRTLTHLVLLRSITHSKLTGSSISQEEMTIIGLGISPELLTIFRSGTTPEAEIWRLFPLEDFTPMFFIDAELLSSLVAEGVDPLLIDLTVAHELGHTLGLVHYDVTHNLMHPGFEQPSDLTCDTTLTEEQLARIRQTLAGRTAAAKPAGPVTAAEAARRRSQTWQALQDHLRGRRPLRLFEPLR